MGSPSFVKSPMFNIAFLLVTMQLSKKINWDNPDILLYARISYYAAQALTILMAYGLIELIKKRNDTTPLRYVPPATPSLSNPQPAENAPVTTTNKDYDISQVRQFIQSTATSILMISAMHWYFKFTQPLVLQSVLPIKNLLTHKVALIHLWGDAAEGQLQRPFKAENPFAAMLGGAGADNAAATAPAAANQQDNHEKKD